jgi:hypothetical protein
MFIYLLRWVCLNIFRNFYKVRKALTVLNAYQVHYLSPFLSLVFKRAKLKNLMQDLRFPRR